MHSFLNAIIWQFSVILEVKSDGDANIQPFATRISVPFQLNALAQVHLCSTKAFFAGLRPMHFIAPFHEKNLVWPLIIWFLCSMLIIHFFCISYY